jgi:hypothetical protein
MYGEASSDVPLFSGVDYHANYTDNGTILEAA